MLTIHIRHNYSNKAEDLLLTLFLMLLFEIVKDFQELLVEKLLEKFRLIMSNKLEMEIKIIMIG